LIDPNDNECNAIFEGEFFSAVYYTPPTYDWDTDFDGSYDGANQPYIAQCYRYSDIKGPPLPAACYRTQTPKALICPTKFKITDDKGRTKEDVLYWGFREN
jgi:hypothetical protein